MKRLAAEYPPNPPNRRRIPPNLTCVAPPNRRDAAVVLATGRGTSYATHQPEDPGLQRRSAADGPVLRGLRRALRVNRPWRLTTINPEICHDKPVIRGLWYPVESILEYPVAGNSFADVLAGFPDLTRQDLLACLEFAKRSLQLRSRHLVLM
jgi:uncharacterized protein (DUF433 family)